jgi:hypothetical protein
MGRNVFTALAGLLLLIILSPALSTAAAGQQTGEAIIRESLARHEAYSSLCEDLTMILTSAQGERSVREVKTFFRKTPREGSQFLLVIDAPAELAGVSLLVHRPPSGKTKCFVYLPAFGKELKAKPAEDGSPVLDTDFTALDFLGEKMDEFRYQRGEDARIDLIDYWVIEALPQSDEIARKAGYAKRRIFVRKDNYFISRIDYLDQDGRLIKRQTRHDLERIEGKTWMANMVLMEGIAAHHQTLLKRSRRVVAGDCAPKEIFTPARIFANPRQAEGKEPEQESGSGKR